jgi:hypothetical protein
MSIVIRLLRFRLLRVLAWRGAVWYLRRRGRKVMLARALLLAAFALGARVLGPLARRITA